MKRFYSCDVWALLDDASAFGDRIPEAWEGKKTPAGIALIQFGWWLATSHISRALMELEDSVAEEKKDDYHLTERSYGSFQRSFRVDDAVDPDKVKAAFEKGVLTVTLPKRPEAAKTEKRIPIGTG